MSKLTEFSSYDHYLKAQRRTSKRPGKGEQLAYNRNEIYRIVGWFSNHYEPEINSLRGICHGVRCGSEMRDFADLTDAEMIGTDLKPLSEDVLQWDFNAQNPDWIGSFDFLYSNSLDHAYQPDKTLAVWFDQLKPTGYLFLQWTRWHNHRPKGGDCFQATLNEYIDLVDNTGQVVDLIYGGKHQGQNNKGRKFTWYSVVIVGRPRIANPVDG